MSDVIAAISTGLVRSAIGILRMSGNGCIEVADRVFSAQNGKPLTQAKAHTLILGQLCDEYGRVIDQCVAVIARAPHSYTGEDTCELQCHGSPAMLAAGLRSLFAAGARQAGPGEFTRRAFLNGKMDLTQAEAVIDLIDAETADAAANAAGQVGGAMLRKIDPIYNDLTDICSHFHAVLDYPDEDIEEFELHRFGGTLREDVRQLDALLSSFSRGRHLKNGIKAAILGKPNAGKSSLLNALCGYDRVIVTEIAGTTRDTVEETVTLGRHLLRLLDTAGIRETADEIERMGVVRAEQAAHEAELAIFVCDASCPLTEEDMRAMDAALAAPRAVAVLNKTDLPPVVQPSDLPFEFIIPTCAKQAEGLDLLEQALDMIFTDDVPCDGSILTNARQADAVLRAANALRAAMASMDAGMTPDAVLVDVESAMLALGEVTGRTMREDITNRIFERFCVGK
ncbi:MAG: tRNA uridine-5-carboxymethylaminomethyl(34) synthesis GTPase MnmE [Oscillospiraceae bacterium]|nr:tRNA uridine-5-carboxymethylaminomethyl(34) synthesis GTPase MnmE [Oscillospiraceae bacterium]